MRIDTYHVLFPTPKIRVLEMTSPSVYKAVLKESALKEDATSGQADQLPTYNAFSADGDVTADLVFVNYGLPEDYELLEELAEEYAQFGVWRGRWAHLKPPEKKKRHSRRSQREKSDSVTE